MFPDDAMQRLCWSFEEDIVDDSVVTGDLYA